MPWRVKQLAIPAVTAGGCFTLSQLAADVHLDRLTI
jgi:hypothetical protein